MWPGLRWWQGRWRKKDGSIQKDECQGHTSKVMLRLLTGATEWAVVPSAKMGTPGNKQSACGRVKDSLGNTERLKRPELGRTFWLKERWPN